MSIQKCVIHGKDVSEPRKRTVAECLGVDKLLRFQCCVPCPSMTLSFERVFLEYAVVASGVLLSALLAGHLSQYATATAALVVLTILYQRQQAGHPGTDQRPHADSGLWLSVLLPFALLTGGNCYPHADSYIIAEVVCSQTLLASVALIYDVDSSIQILSVVWGTFLLIYSTPLFYLAFLTSLCAVLLFQHISSALRKYSPQSFTLGELILVCQAATTFLTCGLTAVCCKLAHGESCSLNHSASAGFLQAGLVSLTIFIATLDYCPRLREPRAFYIGLVLSGAFMAYPSCMIMVNHEPLSWLFMHCFDTPKRLYLMISWLILTIVAICFVSWYTSHHSESSTVVRKVFHGVVVLAFLPGVVLDPDLMYLACGSVLGVFVMLETVRTLRIPPFGQRIHEAFSMFLDEKDCGAFVLTPVYLFVGCGTPLLLFPGRFGFGEITMMLVSGTVSLGIGDTVASVVGSKIGRHKWPGTVKSIEGTVASIAAQFAVYLLLLWAFQSPILRTETAFLLTVLCLNAYLEALTTQVDNLALPVFVYPVMVALYTGYKLY